jgi:hypothetical protein
MAHPVSGASAFIIHCPTASLRTHYLCDPLVFIIAPLPFVSIIIFYAYNALHFL